MIKILRDVIGVNQGMVNIPFTLENLPDKALTLEAIIFDGQNYLPVPNVIHQVTNDSETIIEEVIQENQDDLFVVKLDLTQQDVESVYIRIYNQDTSFVTPMIHITKSESATMQTKAISLEFRPKSVRVLDSVDCTFAGTLAAFDKTNFDIQILASNNSDSTSPVWEDMTTQYLDKTAFEFTNSEKDNDKAWSVAVKYVVTKLSTNSTVEISDVKLIVL